jgi:outer membrane lipopolysaccharide assembly protein LptE/RlpB
MWYSKKLLFLALITLFYLTACGYKPAGRSTISMPENLRTLYLEKVTNPSTLPWIEPRLRTALREELTQRGQVKWVSQENAQGLMQVEILSFSVSSKVKGSKGETLRSQVTLELAAKIFRQKDHTLLWSADAFSVQESFETQNESEELSAGQRAIDLAVQRLANKLNQGF